MRKIRLILSESAESKHKLHNKHNIFPFLSEQNFNIDKHMVLFPQQANVFWYFSRIGAQQVNYLFITQHLSF